MKLGEAKRRVVQNNRRLNELSVVLSHGPAGGIPGTLEECNVLLREREALEGRIRETEATTVIEGNMLIDIQAALDSAQYRLGLLENLVTRTDMGESLREKLFEQLAVFRSTRDQLERCIESCLWETELV